MPPPPPGRQEASPGDQRPLPLPPPSHSGPRAGGGAAPQPPPPHPCQLRSHRRGPPPPRSRRDAPPPQKGRRRGGGSGGWTCCREPTLSCRSNAHNRTVWRPRPTRPSCDHSPLREGRGGVQACKGPRGSDPRAAPHPPQPRGGTSTPTARARRKGARRRHEGGQD